MADQAINALPTKSSPSTGDKVLMIGTAEEYQMLLDDLATAVLDKLTSKSYTLDQGTKTLIAALNELNSKSIKVAVLTTSDNLGTWLGNNKILSGEKMCILALNGAQNNPLGKCYAIIIHSVGYWSKHPQYIKLSDNTITTGVLDCTDTANIKIQG